MALTAQLLDQQASLLASIVANGGTATVSYSVPTQYVAAVTVQVIIVYSTGGNTAGGAGIDAMGIYENRNGASLTTTAAITNSNNPSNNTTATFVAASAQASSVNAGGGAQPTVALTVSGNTVVATVTNQYTSAVDALVLFRVVAAKNV